jgi:hypothetical protein
MMPGGVPFSSTDCNNNLVVASSASIASSSASQASSTSNSDSSSSDTTVSNWVSHHKALVIGVTVAVIAHMLLLPRLLPPQEIHLCQIYSCAALCPPHITQCSPQQGMRRQEHYPMIQYQYGPNK